MSDVWGTFQAAQKHYKCEKGWVEFEILLPNSGGASDQKSKPIGMCSEEAKSRFPSANDPGGERSRNVTISQEDADFMRAGAMAEANRLELDTAGTGMPMSPLMSAYKEDVDAAAKNADLTKQATEIRDQSGNRVDIVDTPDGGVIRETKVDNEGFTRDYYSLYKDSSYMKEKTPFDISKPTEISLRDEYGDWIPYTSYDRTDFVGARDTFRHDDIAKTPEQWQEEYKWEYEDGWGNRKNQTARALDEFGYSSSGLAIVKSDPAWKTPSVREVVDNIREENKGLIKELGGRRKEYDKLWFWEKAWGTEEAVRLQKEIAETQGRLKNNSSIASFLTLEHGYADDVTKRNIGELLLSSNPQDKPRQQAVKALIERLPENDAVDNADSILFVPAGGVGGLATKGVVFTAKTVGGLVAYSEVDDYAFSSNPRTLGTQISEIVGDEKSMSADTRELISAFENKYTTTGDKFVAYVVPEADSVPGKVGAGVVSVVAHGITGLTSETTNQKIERYTGKSYAQQLVQKAVRFTDAVSVVAPFGAAKSTENIVARISTGRGVSGLTDSVGDVYAEYSRDDDLPPITNVGYIEGGPYIPQDSLANMKEMESVYSKWKLDVCDGMMFGWTCSTEETRAAERYAEYKTASFEGVKWWKDNP